MNFNIYNVDSSDTKGICYVSVICDYENIHVRDSEPILYTIVQAHTRVHVQFF